MCEGEEEAESISSSLTPRSSMDTSLSIQDSLVGGLQARIPNILDISKVNHGKVDTEMALKYRYSGGRPGIFLEFLDTGITDYITEIFRKLIQLDSGYHHVGTNKRKQK